MRFLGLDIGTTWLKCGVYDESGVLCYEYAADYGETLRGEEKYIDIAAIEREAKNAVVNAYKVCPFEALAVSSLGESFVLLDDNDNILVPPMLYTDARGKDEAKYMMKDAERIFGIAGVFPHAMYGAYKLLYIKNNYPILYAKAKKVMQVNEYIAYKLTGIRALDCSMSARTGIADIHKKEISNELCDLFGINKELYSPVVPCGSIVGKMKKDFADALGADKDIFVVAGAQDQVCATIGSGALEAGECADGMGTVECITAIYKKPSADSKMGKCGYPNVPFAIDGLYATYLLNYSCGSLTRWWLRNCYGNNSIASGQAFIKAEKDFCDKPTDLLVLPYFDGAATPFQDGDARGAIIGLSLADSPSRVYQGILEGLCYEMRLNLETAEVFGIRPNKLIATGGGSHSKKWLQIKADVCGLPIYPLIAKEAGVCGAAMLAYAAVTKQSIKEIVPKFVHYEQPLLPRKDVKAAYDKLYHKYKTLYKLIKATQANQGDEYANL